MKRIAIFGGGIAGLSAAHELARRGHAVEVFEENPEAGGFFRSARLASHDGMPSEYSWHGFGPWYHNAFDVLKQIPFDAEGSVYDRGLSRPIDFGLAPDRGATQFDDGWVVPVSRMFRMSGLDSVRWGWLMLKTWAANERTHDEYARVRASDAWRPLLSNLGWRTWCACFGPWVGSDWTHVSLHHVGQFFRKQLITRPTHHHRADEEGPAWKQGAGSGWLLPRGPSSECWIDRWVRHLEGQGVRFHWRSTLARLDYDGARITAAHLVGGQEVRADAFVLATHPFAAAEILARTPRLAELDQLRCFGPLTQDGPHTQVSFRIAFAEPIAWPRERAVVIVADSEFNLTLCASEQVWAKDVSLGNGVRSLWTGTACVSKVPGRLHGLPLERCTKEQFLEEVREQLLRCEGLDALIREANGGRGLRSFEILRLEVWHEWLFAPEGIRHRQPKWVTTTRTQPHQPTQRTPVENLVLAGSHTRTQADVWSIEGAVESGRRAAQVLEPSVRVIPQYKSPGLRVLSWLDDFCYALEAPHVLDLLLVACLAAAIVLTVRGLEGLVAG